MFPCIGCHLISVDRVRAGESLDGEESEGEETEDQEADEDVPRHHDLHPQLHATPQHCHQAPKREKHDTEELKNYV